MNENRDIKGKIEEIIPKDLSIRPAQGIQELLRAILMRTNFVPVARHVIGWRGLQQALSPTEGWTAKIKGYAGVFGLSYDSLALVHGWIQGRFRVYYFPEPEEELVELCSIRAAGMTQNDAYVSWIREFQAWPEVAEEFHIARLTLSVTADMHALAVGFDALEAQRSVSVSGVSEVRNGETVLLIEPGGFDRNFPAFATASAFFDVLAASITFNLGQPPVCLGCKHVAWSDLSSAASGTGPDGLVTNNCRHFLMLGYGHGSFMDLDVQDRFCPGAFEWIASHQAPSTYDGKPWWNANLIPGASSMDKKALGFDQRPPLIVLTGFLGSGKTTFLKYFLEYQTQRSRFVAVIQNEIGAVGLDGKLVDYAVTEIDEGCVCCSLAGSLKRAVSGILSDFDPDCIVVETTGLANPMNLLEEMAELDELIRFDCTVGVVDAANAKNTLALHHIAVEQVRAADIVMINKVDLVDQDQLDAITQLVKDNNPFAPIFPVVNAELHPALILDAEVRSADVSPGKQNGVVHLSHLHEGLWARSIDLAGPLMRADFLELVDRLPESIFRAKGIIEFTDCPQPLLFQFVGGRYEISVFPEWSEPRRFLTLIGQGGDPDLAAEAIMKAVTTGNQGAPSLGNAPGTQSG